MEKDRRKLGWGPYSKEPKGTDTFGDRVRSLRVQWDWTQEQLATAIGVSQKTLSRWERGGAAAPPPSSAALEGLSRITGISVQTWLSGHGFEVTDQPFNLDGHLIPSELATTWTRRPPVGPGICLIEPAQEWAHKMIDPQQASELITNAERDGQTVWLVISDV